MIHVRIDNHHSTALDIYVDISSKNTMTSSSPIPSSGYHSIENEHIYDRLFDTKHFPYRQSKIVKNRSESIRPENKKNYTLQQILDNVETIQKQYEQVITKRTTTSSSPSCFWTFKQITKILKNLRTIKNQTNEETTKNNDLETKSPFIFGGETLQWIALPQDDNHIYENQSFQ